ncbi:MAG: thioredoxin family protein [Methanothrix sp.]|nr:MAG: thioredoxin family protein [Methanothrix sp.]
MTKIEILGTDCAKCKSLHKNAEKAVQELDMDAEVIKVDSIQEIMNRGIMMIPGLAIDGEIILVGRSPSVEELKKMFKKV